MAQALVVQGDESGALDLYRRVLGADPENADAYVGIARIFHNREQLEEAVWYMERAYELAPVQSKTRQELLRLYARLGGTPRERLKLTRGALGRLYVQEGLFAQAIREFREIASAAPSRYDTRVALAETLWRAGQTRQAADVAQSLLGSLPYCLKANLILGTAWHESGIEESETFLQRAQALDPSNQIAQKLLGERSPLRPVQAKVPRFVDGASHPLGSAEEKTTPATLEPVTAEKKSATIPSPIVLEPAPELVESVSEPEPESTESVIAPEAKPSANAVVQAPQPRESVSAPETVETQEEALAEKTEHPPVYEKPVVPKPLAFADLPPWLSGETIPAETSRVEPPAAIEPSPDAQGAPDWLAELRKTFSEKSEEGIPPQVLPMPTIKIDESWMKTEPGSAMPIEEESTPVEPVLDTPEADLQVTPPQSSQMQGDLVEELPVESESTPAMAVEEEPVPVESVQEMPTVGSEEVIPAQLSQMPTDHIEEPLEDSEHALAMSSEEEPVATEPVQEMPEAEAKPVESAQMSPEQIEEPPAPPETILLPAMPVDKKPAPAVSAQPTLLVETALSASVTEDDELPDWLRGEYLEELLKSEPVQEKEIPSWLQAPSLEKSAEPVKPPPQIKMPKWVEVLSQPVRKEDETPEKKPAAETQLETKPALTEELKPELTREATLPEPMMTESEPPIVVETTPRESIAPAAQDTEEMPPKSKRQPKYYSRLVQAREHRDANRWSDAVTEYDFVIQKAPRLINEVIVDLEALVAREDAPLDAHRLLGDAYARAGRLNDALERYRFVFERVSD